MVKAHSEEAQAMLQKHSPEPEALQLIPEAMARKYIAIPLALDGNTLRVAMANPSDIFALEALASRSQMRIKAEVASAEEIQEAIDFNYKAYDEIERQISNISSPSGTTDERVRFDTATDAPVAQALTLIIDEAVKARASDIHLQPEEDKLRVRYRIDGTLQDMFSLPLKTTTPLISRIKILASMNIADHYRPQDGQFSIKTKDRLIDVRVGTIATVYGEMAALRLLDKSRGTLTLTELGFRPESLEKYEKMLKVPYGMILVSGPTGAGKTTTLYASINCLDQVGRNIITVEDPVEYRFRDINQIQVNPRAGITFSAGLRSILRLDPDVILVGEIRDAETANIAIQSALTGHLVLSSIHANDVIGVVLRLLDLGIEPFLVS
ncbi:GspE/PulE family protein, partial [Chloroflexota bacterium]